MGLFSILEGRRASVLAGASVSSTSGWLTDLLGVTPSSSGVEVTPVTSLSSTVVLNIVQRKAKTLAMLPAHLYKRQLSGARKRELFTEDPRYRMLRYQPNPEMSAYDFQSLMQTHLDLHGNAIAEIERDKRDRPIGLWWLMGDRFRMVRVKGELWYLYSLDGKEVPIHSRNVLHIRGWGYRGGKGECLVDLAKDAVGLARAHEISSSKFYTNGMSPSGVIQHPDSVSEDGMKAILRKYESVYGGLTNSQRLMILDEGMTFKERGVSPAVAQLLEGRQFQVTDLARVWLMPPHMAGDLTQAHHKNMEQQAIEFLVYCMGPDICNWEQQYLLKLFTEEEQKEFFVEFLVEQLLKGDTETRFKAYEILIRNSMMSPDEGRDKENMNRLPNELGAHYYMPVNFAPVEKLLAMPAGALNVAETGGTGTGGAAPAAAPGSSEETVDGEEDTRAALAAGLMMRNMRGGGVDVVDAVDAVDRVDGD